MDFFEFKNINASEIFVRQIKSPFVYLLLVVAIISILIGQFVDSIAVLAFVFIIIIIVGFFREYRIRRATAILQKLIPQETKVSRDLNNTPYEKSILYFCKLILRIVTVTIILIFVANILIKGISNFWEFLLFSVALTVSILPEALPAVATFALSEGSLKMAREKVVVKRLSAIEDLGNIEILCADETCLKSGATEAIRLAKKLGVSIKIFTADSKSRLIQNSNDVVLGSQLKKMTTEDFDDVCLEKVVFARISPDLKHKIIKSLQKKYEVGFAGEGVNDALALKTADVGIAVVESSDTAREAADVVLLQKDLRVIVGGIKNARMIFSNINKYIKCALASNFGNFYSIAVISLFVNFLPMLPVQILLAKLLFDLPLISIATDSADVEELKKPKSYELHNVLPLIISLALVSTVFDFIFFAIFLRQAPAVIQTLWFIESILTEILLIFIIRTRGKFWEAIRPSFWLFFFTIIDGIFIVALPFLPFGQQFFHFVTLPILPLLIVFFLAGCYFASSEFVKLVYFKYWKPRDSVVS